MWCRVGWGVCLMWGVRVGHRGSGGAPSFTACSPLTYGQEMTRAFPGYKAGGPMEGILIYGSQGEATAF